MTTVELASPHRLRGDHVRQSRRLAGRTDATPDAHCKLRCELPDGLCGFLHIRDAARLNRSPDFRRAHSGASERPQPRHENAARRHSRNALRGLQEHAGVSDKSGFAVYRPAGPCGWQVIRHKPQTATSPSYGCLTRWQIRHGRIIPSRRPVTDKRLRPHRAERIEVV